jgi:hypothetical protein
VPDVRGFPIGQVLCGYRLCNADVANVWPAVPAEAAAGRGAGADPQDADPELVGAGLRLAGPDAWPLLGSASPAATLAQRRHRVDFRPGIAPGADGVFGLTRRAEQAWQKAKRFRVPWKRFAPLERRPRFPVEDERRPVRRVVTPGGPFRFRCPLCGRVNAAVVAAACPDDCVLHVTDEQHFDSMHWGLWWWPPGSPDAVLPLGPDGRFDDLEPGLRAALRDILRPDCP